MNIIYFMKLEENHLTFLLYWDIIDSCHMMIFKKHAVKICAFSNYL